MCIQEPPKWKKVLRFFVYVVFFVLLFLMWAKPVKIEDDFTEADSQGHILRVNGKPFAEYLAEKGVNIRDIEIDDKEFYLSQLAEKEEKKCDLESGICEEVHVDEEEEEDVKIDQGQCGLTPESCNEEHEEHEHKQHEHKHHEHKHHEHKHHEHKHHEHKHHEHKHHEHKHHEHSSDDDHSQCGLTPESCNEETHQSSHQQRSHHQHNHQHKASSSPLRDEDKHPFLAVALTTISALAATVGGAIVVFAYPPSPVVLGQMLAFSAGIMLYISYMDIMVHAQMDLSMFEANCWMFVGMAGFLLLTHFIPEMEHSHDSESDMTVEEHKKSTNEDINESEKKETTVEREKEHSHDKSSSKRSLEMTGLITAIVVFNATVVGVCDVLSPPSFSLSYLYEYLTKCTGRGLVVATAIAIHNIPEGIAVALPLYYSTRSKWEAMKWCLLSSICEPIAAIVFGILFSDYLTERLMAIMNSMVAGIMIILCVFELIPTALNFTSAKNVAVGTIVGQFVMFISLYFLIDAGAH